MLYPNFDPIIVSLGPISVRWYGAMYLVGFAAAWALGRYRARRPGSPLSVQQFDDLLFYCALGVILGGRIGYLLFYSFDAWLADPMVLVRVWEGGMSFHGGLLGVLVAIALFCRKHRLRFFPVGDFIAPLVPLGLFTGRIGNFINGELWGRPTDLPWGMQVPCAGRFELCQEKLGLARDALMTPPLHPNQLYEAGLEGVLLFVVLWWYSARPRSVPSVGGLFLIGYGIARFLIEFVRMPDAHLGYLAFGWLTMGQLLSLPMILAGLALLLWARRDSRNATVS